MYNSTVTFFNIFLFCLKGYSETLKEGAMSLILSEYFNLWYYTLDTQNCHGVYHFLTWYLNAENTLWDCLLHSVTRLYIQAVHDILKNKRKKNTPCTITKKVLFLTNKKSLFQNILFQNVSKTSRTTSVFQGQ